MVGAYGKLLKEMVVEGKLLGGSLLPGVSGGEQQSCIDKLGGAGVSG